MLWKLNFIIIWVLNLITEFWAEGRKQKHFLKAGTLDNQERHIALEMSTSRTAHTKRGGESTPAKQYQGKAWATKT
jgi:hypothetical protein